MKKTTKEMNCPYCGQLVNETDIDAGMSKSKRNTITLFHVSCYEL